MNIDDQIKNVQESQLFADRRTEELNEAVLDLAQQLSLLTARLASLESKIGVLADALTTGDRVTPGSELPSE